ncbi:hypothetical protein [Rhizobium sp.]|uniref:hypothetical protein n=1 Tax=Rhizobium sp. TaxID=391 RepID=UPI002AA6B7FA
MEDNLRSGDNAVADVSSKSFHGLNGLLKGKTNGRILSIEEINEGIAEACVAAYLSASSFPLPCRASPPQVGRVDGVDSLPQE